MDNHITLPQPDRTGQMTLSRALEARRSVRSFSAAKLAQPALAQLLWAAAGITSAQGHRAAPSAGGQYPLHLYVYTAAVDEIPSGLYAYSSQQHALVRQSNEDVRPALAAAAIGEQPWISDAAAVLIVLADMPRMTAHFCNQPPQGERGGRYAWIETGALAENVYLQATSLGLGCVLSAGFDDAQLQMALATPALHPTALLCIGGKAQ